MGSSYRYPLPVVRRRRSALARLVWWVMFVPRLVVGGFVASAFWTVPGDHMNGWWFVAGLAAFWLVSPFRFHAIRGRRRAARRERLMVAAWQAQGRPVSVPVEERPLVSAPGPAARVHSA